ncbi:hypothetical protein H2O64_19190 [Kordia sp. YSTF-M3]|uniref:DUF3575 domain-containing protein n=1 Tax=Kordia aestuariivivens TaxID=2759037 RepID=A0ABR7QE01_9FLAO|nr:hypothetical protein [Kordia aestuariivivens]MBC8756807.1 hypothetical protein [Kordia aestuariivivens]
MKKIMLTVLCCGITFISTAQDASVEKSIFGVQTGLFGIWAHNEAKLSNQFALRTEVGLDAGIFISDNSNLNGFSLIPAITLEPRWYYNLDKRQSKSRRTDGNSGNFFSIKTTYHPDLFVISNRDKNTYRFISDISIVPTWGIRRSIGKHFNYETGIGVGYIRFFEPDGVILFDEHEVAINLHLRIGYRF